MGRKTAKRGDRKSIDGKPCVFFEGYWIRYYAPPKDTLRAKRALMENLTRRTFHHTERGINTPGERLEMARDAYARQTDPARKRVNGAMLAGALFNRATDIFTSIVELEEKGVKISRKNELLKQCGECFKEALELGRTVRHYSGEEGIDELWGEPFKAFTMPIEAFYESRYIKIAQTMRDIDTITTRLADVLESNELFRGITPMIREFADAAKLESETLRSDPVIFDIWPRFVAAGDALLKFRPEIPLDAPDARRRQVSLGAELLNDGKRLIEYLAGARVPMPKSARDFLTRCDRFTEVPAGLGA